MEPDRPILRCGSRRSPLALIQTRQAMAVLSPWCDPITDTDFTTPGDRDQQTDLRQSPPDFFTRDLDQALRSGRIDVAVHSAKDLPDTMPEDLDWVWLPEAGDPRDCLVLAPGHRLEDLPPAPRCGVSSQRREDWCRARFPQARLLSIRGCIDDRLAQLDRGNYDLLLMAGVALQRLGLEDRISAWIERDELPTPDGQGVLALSFCRGHPLLTRLRARWTKALRFVGAGVGDHRACTLAAVEALTAAEVCLFDRLLDERVLDHLPPDCQRIDVGKRCGDHGPGQAMICRLIADHARRGRRVVRLKGGDPGIFGRLAEELETLDGLALPWQIIPGLTALQVATTGSGLLPTRRTTARGFTVATPRAAGDKRAALDAPARAALPLILYMATGVLDAIRRELLDDGLDPATPAALVFDAGGPGQRIIQDRLDAIRLPPDVGEAPGLVLIGSVAQGGPCQHGPLAGQRVLVTCSAEIQAKTALRIRDLGGIPVELPLIQLVADDVGVRRLPALVDQQDWMIISSPAAARIFIDHALPLLPDRRRLPRLLACGPGTAAALATGRLPADAVAGPGAGVKAILAWTAAQWPAAQRLLRLRSDVAGPALAEALRTLGHQVEDLVLYRTVPRHHQAHPSAEVVLFASASAVAAWQQDFGLSATDQMLVAAIGQPTAAALCAAKRAPDCIATTATMEGLIEAVADEMLRRSLNHERHET